MTGQPRYLLAEAEARARRAENALEAALAELADRRPNMRARTINAIRKVWGQA